MEERSESQRQGPATSPRVLALIVTYNSEAWIAKLLKALEKQDYPGFDICVSDDASTDNTVEVAREHCEGKARVVVSAKNSGRCSAINRVLPLRPTYDYLVLLNAATLPDRNFLTEIVHFAISRGSTFGGATPRVLDLESTEQYLSRPTRGLQNFVRNIVLAPARAEEQNLTEEPWFEVDSFWGCACILNASMVDDLRFDEELRLFSEEEDLATRAGKAGYKFYAINTATVLYKPGVSTTDLRGITPLRMYYGLRNKIYIALKYYSGAEAFLVILTAIIYSIFVACKRPTLLPQVLRATGWNLRRMARTLSVRRRWQTLEH